MATTIRRAVPADAARLTRCFRAAYAPYLQTIPDLPDVAGGIGDDIAAHLVWVAEAQGEIVGGLVLVLGDHAHLANLAVHPDHGGKGIARTLIALAETQARGAGHDALHLATHVAMPDNVALYAHLGWHETGRSGSKVMMVKPL